MGTHCSDAVPPSFEVTRPVPRQGMQARAPAAPPRSPPLCLLGLAMALSLLHRLVAARHRVEIAFRVLERPCECRWLGRADQRRRGGAARGPPRGGRGRPLLRRRGALRWALSWHNFFFGAFEPGATVSLDKPPLDLWPQVLSVKLFGFGLARAEAARGARGTLAVPLLFAARAPRRSARAPALASALALAVLPIEVITARSDTMDAIMMALIVARAAAASCARCETGAEPAGCWRRRRRSARLQRQAARVLVRAAGARAVSPGSGCRGRRGARRGLLAARGRGRGVRRGGALLADARRSRSRRTQRPYAIGSTNGSAVERGVRLQRRRPAARQASSWKAPAAAITAAALSAGHPGAARPHPDHAARRRHACSRASARSPASGSASRCWRRCCSACRRSRCAGGRA